MARPHSWVCQASATLVGEFRPYYLEIKSIQEQLRSSTGHCVDRLNNTQLDRPRWTLQVGLPSLGKIFTSVLHKPNFFEECVYTPRSCPKITDDQAFRSLGSSRCSWFNGIIVDEKEIILLSQRIQWMSLIIPYLGHPLNYHCVTCFRQRWRCPVVQHYAILFILCKQSRRFEMVQRGISQLPYTIERCTLAKKISR